MFGLSHTAGYALLALAYLEDREGHWVLAKDIAAATGTAGPYLSKILHTLAKVGLIRAKRGYRGGFALARPAAEIGLLEIVDAVEDRARTPRCLLGLVECSDQRDCPVHHVWKTARTRIEAYLQRLTLAEIALAMRRHAVPTAPKSNRHDRSLAKPPAARRSEGRASGKRSKAAAPRAGSRRARKSMAATRS